ncbi:MAG: PolC-type DNA polymerase III [Oscillospiraceae bacterium]|jgi:DNA polymerase-3 subunit alpha (Gram-positive type)|nr:PolC-type DNA polymerase III [Oscillospiraceae bacterium]
MKENTNPKFSEMFENCSVSEELSAALVVAVKCDKSKQTMEIELRSERPLAPMMLTMAEAQIRDGFGLKRVSISSAAPAPQKKTQKKQAGEVLIGSKPIKGVSIKMSELNADSGRVTVEGEVFDFDVREWKNGGGKTTSFSLTDFASSVRVKVTGDLDVQPGDWIRVQGNYIHDRFYGDYLIDGPNGVERIGKTTRNDNHEGGKRVELHLHTKMSAMDALTDAEQVVATAARWGHKAIAITDHAVVHAYPEFGSAAKKYGIKPIFGVEAYYVNDIDDKLVVSGTSGDRPLNEYIAFDLETTGLSLTKDRITEIGAVLMRDGVAAERFSMMVNPGFPIPPEITKLTGIRDIDVAVAPGEFDAVPEFLKFAGNRLLVAHNSDFDTGILTNACKRLGLAFEFTAVDTVALAQNLMPEESKYNLAAVATALQLPDFNHHRAVDDAETLSRIMEEFRKRLEVLGITSVAGIDDYFREQRAVYALAKRYPKHIILLVKEQQGLKNLYKLVSEANLNPFTRGHPVITKSMINSHREGLLVGSACENSEVFRAITGGVGDRELLRLAEFYDYFEIMPLANNMFMLNSNRSRVSTMEDLRDFNRRMVWLGETTGKPVCATGDVHFLEPEHEIFRAVLTAQKFDDADKDLPLYFKTTAEMLTEFAYLGEETAYKTVVTNPNLIADMCEEIQLLPKGLCKPKLENSCEDLENLVYGRMKELYGENPPELIAKRVDDEMKDILDKGYDVIYISAQRLVSSSNRRGYLVGSRGSVGSSFAAYLAGITEVNSLPPHYRCPNCRNSDFESGKGYGVGADMPDAVCPNCGTKYAKEGFDIPFETFLGFGGDKVPDIDLNFSGEDQANAHRDAIEMFGSASVFRAGTIGGLADKTAYGYVKKYCEARGVTWPKAEEERLCKALTGVKKTTGQHPGGLVIVPQNMEIYDFCPIQHPGDDKEKNVITTHIEYHAMEANLLKLDMLGHDDPSMIKMLTDLTGIDARELPLDDPEMMALFTNGVGDDGFSSVGIPEFGTGFTRGMLEDTKPTKFSTLIRLSGFSHGTDVWLGNAKDLLKDGHNIEDIIGCRDDIMLYLISKGMEDKLAFKIMEAVRKGKGLTDEWEKAMRGVGVQDWYIDSCNKIKYLFPKAHASAYVIMAARIAWYKVHKPLEFYAAYFSVRAAAFDLEAMSGGAEAVKRKMKALEQSASDARKKLNGADEKLFTALEVCLEMWLRGYSMTSVDFYKSDAERFRIEGNSLIPPFITVGGLGIAAAAELVAAREQDKDWTIEELAAACPKLTSTQVELLRQYGSFGEMQESAQISFFD